MHKAAEGGFAETLAMLVRRGADLSAMDEARAGTSWRVAC